MLAIAAAVLDEGGTLIEANAGFLRLIGLEGSQPIGQHIPLFFIQPDFATLKLEYVPDERCVELKSLKLYIWSFRNRGTFHEAVTNEILRDLVNATAPRFMRLVAEFNVRGGIYTSVVAEHRQPAWIGPEPVTLP